MKFKEALKKLQCSDEFKKWKKVHRKDYLSYGFIILGESGEDSWRIGYYDKSDDSITSFVVDSSVLIEPREEVFKHEESVVKEILIDDLLIDYDEALSIANELRRENYKNEVPCKTVMILQNIDAGLVWNITYVTGSMATLNIKIDAKNRKILEHKLIPLFEFSAK